MSTTSVDNGSAFAMRGSCACVSSADCALTCAVQGCTEGSQVAILESAVGEIDILVATAGIFNIIRLEHMLKRRTPQCWQHESPRTRDTDGCVRRVTRHQGREHQPQGNRSVFLDGHGFIIRANAGTYIAPTLARRHLRHCFGPRPPTPTLTPTQEPTPTPPFFFADAGIRSAHEHLHFANTRRWH